MKALKLKLVGFRSYDNSVVDLERGVKVIVGENNVGKSSLLAALQVLRNTGGLTPEDWPYGNPLGPMSIRLTLVLTQSEVRKIANELEIPEGNISDLGTELVVGMNWEKPAGAVQVPIARLGPLHFFSRWGSLDPVDPRMGFTEVNWGQILYAAKASKDSIWKVARAQIAQYLGSLPGAAGRISFVKNPFEVIAGLLQERIVIFPEFRQRPQEGAATEGIQSPEGSLVPAVLFNLKNSQNKTQRKRYVMIQKFFTSLFPTLRLEAVKGPRIVVERADIGSEVPLHRIGAGIAQMITLLTHLVGSEEMIFVLDGPELHLHPHSQRLLRTVLRNSSKNQVIMVTHSADFVDFSDPGGIIVVRQLKGQSRAVQLPPDFLTDEERNSLSKMIWSEDKDFLFSKRVLLSEGATEYGAVPIIANRLNRNLDEHAVSIVTVGGDYFGLFLKLLKGFGFPRIVMCDRDALVNIGRGKVTIGAKKIRTSPVFYSIWKAGVLTKKDTNKLALAETRISSSTVGTATHETYSKDQRDILETMARAYGFRFLDPNFEGFLETKGLQTLLRDARLRYPGDKVLQGRYLAANMSEIPLEFRQVLAEVCSLK